jgi:hypothetical protein
MSIRPLAKPLPVPIAATIALEMIGMAWTGSEANLDRGSHHPGQDIEARKPLPTRRRTRMAAGAQAASPPDAAKPTKFEQFVASHPSVRARHHEDIR